MLLFPTILPISGWSGSSQTPSSAQVAPHASASTLHTASEYASSSSRIAKRSSNGPAKAMLNFRVAGSMPAGQSPIVVAQFAPQHLAGVIARQGAHEIHRLRKFVSRYPLRRPRNDSRLVRIRTGGENDHGLDCLAPFFVRHADHRDFRDCGMTVNGVLDFGRINVLAARDDEDLGAILQQKVSILV